MAVAGFPIEMLIYLWWVPLVIICLGCCFCGYLWHKIKQIRIVKQCLKCCGGVLFDDLWLTIVVHEILTEVRDNIAVRIRAGSYEVETEYMSPVAGGTFQETLNLFVESGADEVSVEVICARGLVAKLTLSCMEDIIKQGDIMEKSYTLRPKMRGVHAASATLSLVATQEEDGVDYYDPPDIFHTRWLVERQMAHLKEDLEAEAGGEEVTDLQVLKKVCNGPLDMYEPLGARTHVFIAVLDPRTKYNDGVKFKGAVAAVTAINRLAQASDDAGSAAAASSAGSRKQPAGKSPGEKAQKAKWRIAMWPDKSGWEALSAPQKEIDLLRISSVQADPDQRNTFAIKYFDENRTPQEVRFRRIERPRDIWVESLRSLISLAHEEKRRHKEHQQARSASEGNTPRGGKKDK